MKIENLDVKFEALFKKLNSDSFLKMKALGGEIPFYISTYNPTQQIEIEKYQKSLFSRLQNCGINLLEINLFDLCVKLLTERGIFHKLLAHEPKMEKARFLVTLKAPLDIEHNLLPEIDSLLQEENYHIVFLTGVGLVYPFLRSHTILNNLQKVIKNIPTILFFPGEYTGTSLELFDKLHDDNYYRAFNLDSLHY